MSKIDRRKAKTFRCVLVIDINAKDKDKAAKRFINEIEQGWVLPEDVQVRTG